MSSPQGRNRRLPSCPPFSRVGVYPVSLLTLADRSLLLALGGLMTFVRGSLRLLRPPSVVRGGLALRVGPGLRVLRLREVLLGARRVLAGLGASSTGLDSALSHVLRPAAPKQHPRQGDRNDDHDDDHDDDPCVHGDELPRSFASDALRGSADP